MKGFSHTSRHRSVDSLLAGNAWERRSAALRYRADVASRDHGDPGDAPSVPPPLTDVANAVRPSAAEEARTIAASTNRGTLATLTATGDPWASLVTYGLLDGAPVLCVSNMAEHGRNLAGDPRASIAIVAPATDPDPLASGRVTLAGVVERRPTTNSRRRAMHIWQRFPRRSTTSTTATSRCGCFGCSGCAGSAATDGWTRRRARRTPPRSPTRSRLVPRARSAISTTTTPRRCARWRKKLGGYPDATAATCTGADRYGLDLKVSTPRGVAYTRVGYAAPIDSYDDLRSATVELAARARISRDSARVSKMAISAPSCGRRHSS